MKLFRILDPFTATLITVVLLASFFPARGAFVPFFEHLTTAAIALLFFMHGAKLSREAIIAGGSHWRLHLWVMCSTFILFPLLGVLFAVGAGECRSDALQRLYLSVHSAGHRAIRYRLYFAGRGQRRGCGLLSLGLQPAGDLCFPATGGVLMNLHGAGGSLEQVGKIMLQLLLPFVLGHLSRPWIGDWVAKHKKWIGKTDQTSILLVVYSAFSEAVVNGIWHKVGLGSLLFIVVVSWCCWPSSSRSTSLSPAAAALTKPMRLPSSSAVRRAGQRHSDGQYSLPDLHPRHHGAAVDDLPPNPADGLRGAGAALQAANRCASR